MKKKLMSILLACLMAFLCSVPALAVSYESAQNVPESGDFLERTLSDLELSNSVITVNGFDDFSIVVNSTDNPGLFSRNSASLRKTSTGVHISIEVPNVHALDEISVDVSKGYSIDYVRHLYTNEPLDGSIVIYDTTGAPVVATTEPMIYDADGVRVPSEFVMIENGFLPQVAYDGEIQYPLTVNYTLSNVSAVTRALTIESYWTEYYGHMRDNGYCFTFAGRLFPASGSGLVENSSWIAVKDYFQDHPEWTNEQGLYEQYMCHADTELFQDIFGNETWDIEPWRPAVGSLLTMLSACNP